MEQFLKNNVLEQLNYIHDAGLYKKERVIASPQGVEIKLSSGQKVLNFCSNNYLGLANHPKVLQAAHSALDQWGYGMSSVRFICGTLEVHKQLEKKVSEFLKTDDTILYAACFDANGGVFEPFFTAGSTIFTDELNHASLIDGIRLTKAQRQIFKHSDMNDLEFKLNQCNSDLKIIVTDGVFSMDGEIAQLDQICRLAKQYQALVLVDDSHATGVVGETGRGTPELYHVEDQVDLLTTTFGKALGGASGGCVSGRKELIGYLRQKSRPYLFSNTLAPVIAGTTLEVIDLLDQSNDLIQKLKSNTKYFKNKLTEIGFDVRGKGHPIIPIFLYDEKLAGEMADELLKTGIYVIGFSYPVVPKGKARIRVQISAGFSREQLDFAIDAFEKVYLKFKDRFLF